MPALVVLIALALVVGLIVSLASGSSSSRANAFASRHMITPNDAGRAYLTEYLRHTRRWRIAGVVAGVVVSTARSPQQSTNFSLAWILAGWFAGAVVAELRAGAMRLPAAAVPAIDPDVVDPAAGLGPRAAFGPPRWLLRIPLAIGGLAVLSTAVTLVGKPAAVEPFDLAKWGMAVLVCALLVEVTTSRVLARPAEPISADLDLSVRSNGIGAVAGAGVVVAILCVTHQMHIIQAASFNQQAAVLDGMGTVWSVVALFLGWEIAYGGRHARVPGRRPPRPISVITVASALVIGTAIWLGDAAWVDHAPYRPAAIGATATVRMTTDDTFEADEHALGITGLTGVDGGNDSRAFVGRVDFTTPAAAHGAGRYYVVVIDSRDNTVAPSLYDRDGSGWDGFLDDVPAQIPWLSALRPHRVGDGYSDAGAEVSADAGSTGPIVFTGEVARAGASIDDLTIALIFVGNDQQIYWATRVPVS